jgi:hypothetical protein
MKGLMIVIGIVAVAFGLLLMFTRGLFSTRYAPRYSEAAFERIAAGDDMSIVIGALGEPLNKRTNRQFIVWAYTESAGLGRFWKCRQIIVSNDMVLRKMSFTMD